MSETDVNLSLVLVGDANVGKTSLLNRFVLNQFLETRPTTGIDYVRKAVRVLDKTVTVRFWDTAGSEKFNALSDAYFKYAAGVFLVFDVTREATFDKLRLWLMIIKDKCRENIKVALIGNKNDLIGERQVSFEAGSKFAKENGLFYFETSAKENKDEGVEKAFNELVRETFSLQEKEFKRRSSVGKKVRKVQRMSLGEEKKAKGCCG